MAPRDLPEDPQEIDRAHGWPRRWAFGPNRGGLWSRIRVPAAPRRIVESRRCPRNRRAGIPSGPGSRFRNRRGRGPPDGPCDRHAGASSPGSATRQLAQRLEIHYTPKHGSWLNIAEIELSALCGQCLDRRIPSLAGMQREIGAWVADRNQRQTEIDWQFKTEDARIKLKSLYPQL